MIERVLSGGQTGVDRAALDAAREAKIAISGWCPRGRRAEDGAISERYPLIETPSAGYAQRTEWNVRDADGTLILNRGALERGTALTVRMASRWGKPRLTIELQNPPSAKVVLDWFTEDGIRVLNIAGPREGQRPGIYAEALEFLHAVFSMIGN
ncbi:MAG: putative molybdenum carrier protein [Gammaproteobacteria bacterium]